MPPNFNGFLSPKRRSLIDGHAAFGYDSDEDEDMAQLEDNYQQSRIQAGPEVEEFGRWLDECGLTHATPSQRRERILKLVSRYHDFTSEKAAVLRERRRLEKLARGRGWDETQSSDDANDMDVDEAGGSDDTGDVDKWDTESQTWGLLSRLLPLRNQEASAIPPKSTSAPRSRREHWDEFILSDSVAQERKAVLEWLQSTACAGPDIDELVQEYQQKADRGDLLAHNWLHTREAIKLHKSVNAIPHVLEPTSNMSGFSYVTQLDPDAMTRQGRKLEPHDEFFERAIWLRCYHLLRRGTSMDEIRDWCLERTETWRAATISALPLSTMGDEDVLDFDPPSFILWRRMCYALVKSGGTDDWERATYGILSGDIDSVLSVCKTWDDFIFTHYNALLRTQFDSYLIKQSGPRVASTQFLPSFDAVQYLGDTPNVAKRLIEQVESDASNFKQASKEANTAAKALQGAIIADTLESYIYQQGLALSAEANQEGKSYLIPDYGYGSTEGNVQKYSKMSEHDGLRVVTHVVIMINALESVSQNTKDYLPGRRMVGEHAIAAYVSFLRLAQLELLIPLYCAHLSPKRQYETLSLNIIHVRDREEQLALLNQIRRVGMDIKTFLREQPHHFLKQLEDSESTSPDKGLFRILKHKQPESLDGRGIVPDFIGGDGQNEVLHENLIRAMEWLFAGEGNLLEACEFGIKIYKFFLKNKHLGAARDFYERVKVEDLVQVLANRDVGSSAEEFVEDLLTNEHALLGEVEDDEVDDIKVHQTRLALAVKNMWELQCFVMALDGIETVGTLAQLAQEPETSRPGREYIESLGNAIKSAKTGMKPVLKGWLLETNTKDDEFSRLREAYLPETVLAYVAALQYTGGTLTRDNMLEAMELAATIAGKDSDVAALFVRTGRMKELVEAFASCSKALAINTSDHKKTAHASTKKMREMGWSKELWAVKPSS